MITLSEVAVDMSARFNRPITREHVLQAARYRRVPIKDGRIPRGRVADVYFELVERITTADHIGAVLDDYFTFDAATRR